MKAVFLLVLIVGTVWIAVDERSKRAEVLPYQRNEGRVFGTILHAQYQYGADLEDEIMKALEEVDGSLSMFNAKSTLSRINRGECDSTDAMVEELVKLAMEVSGETNGAFDITVAPLVNAWGFGFKNGMLPDSAQVDSLRALVGWKRIRLEDGRLQKEDERMVLDMSAIAKGYGCDVVGRVFAGHGIENWMIEIGGEVVTHGVNSKGQPWSIGINKPKDDECESGSEIQEVLHVRDRAMATSGNYRNYYVTEDGRRLAHTIDPHSGRPVQHNILSSTVLAPTCAMADAYATSFMVMGLDKAKEVLSRHPELEVYFVCSDGKDGMTTWTNIEQLKEGE